MILIGTKYKLEADSMNIILSKKKRRIRKDTKEVYEDWAIMGYFATVKGALHELVNQGVRDTALKDLKSISGKIDGLYDLISNSSISVPQP